MYSLKLLLFLDICCALGYSWKPEHITDTILSAFGRGHNANHKRSKNVAQVFAKLQADAEKSDNEAAFMQQRLPEYADHANFSQTDLRLFKALVHTYISTKTAAAAQIMPYAGPSPIQSTTGQSPFAVMPEQMPVPMPPPVQAQTPVQYTSESMPYTIAQTPNVVGGVPPVTPYQVPQQVNSNQLPMTGGNTNSQSVLPSTDQNSVNVQAGNSQLALPQGS